MTTTTFTHNSYEAANKAAMADKGVTYTSDAGNGWIHEVTFDHRLKRLVHCTINPEGIRIY
jgi:hypothetical protein